MENKERIAEIKRVFGLLVSQSEWNNEIIQPDAHQQKIDQLRKLVLNEVNRDEPDMKIVDGLISQLSMM